MAGNCFPRIVRFNSISLDTTKIFHVSLFRRWILSPARRDTWDRPLNAVRAPAQLVEARMRLYKIYVIDGRNHITRAHDHEGGDDCRRSIRPTNCEMVMLPKFGGPRV
jgi:hypothetical protein